MQTKCERGKQESSNNNSNNNNNDRMISSNNSSNNSNNMAINHKRKPSILSLTEGERLSISEPSLTDVRSTIKYLDRFEIKHPHEYIAVDDLKYFRRRRTPDFLTKSQICLYTKHNKNGKLIDAGALPLKTEYTSQFVKWDLAHTKPILPIRRSTSLRLEGLMPFNISEYRDRYILYSPEDWKSCRTYPIRRPESLCWISDTLNKMDVKEMESKYKTSSYITSPMLDNSMKILPREIFKSNTSIQDPKDDIHMPNNNTLNEPEIIHKAMIIKNNANKSNHNGVKESHLSENKRAITCNDQQHIKGEKTLPSEYKHQFIKFPIEKAHSIPQISHLKMQGNFQGVPEYKDSFKSHTNYIRPMLLKKADNLLVSGSEVCSKDNWFDYVPEYREQFDKPLNVIPKKEKPLKVPDHLHVSKESIKDIPEYHESYRPPPPNIQMPERGKCPESHLRLKGKLEFDPEYRNVYLDFPRARPIVPKPISTFHLPTATTSTTDIKTRTNIHGRCHKSTQPSTLECTAKLEEDYNNNSESSICSPIVTDIGSRDITKTPEYRRATYNYQIKERSPLHKIHMSDSNIKHIPKAKNVYPAGFAAATTSATANTTNNVKRKPIPLKQIKSEVRQQPTSTALANYGRTKIQKTPKFGRRASALRNADNCRERTSIIEGNPNYRFNSNNVHDSFLILDNHVCKR